MKAGNNPLDLPLPRFKSERQIKVIVKKTRSRFSCFWLDVANISGSGVGIIYHGHGHMPFAIEDELNLTLDTGCAAFRRPIHLMVCVKWREECLLGDDEAGPKQTILGCQILLIDPMHHGVWKEGLEKLAELEREAQRVYVDLLVSNS